MRIYQVIECSGEWEDYHEWVVCSTFDPVKAHYIKSLLENHEEMLKDDEWYEPSWYRVDKHNVDEIDDSIYSFLDTMINTRGKLRSPIFRG